MSSTPKVSVCIVTYNHENYIEQALLSALTQRTKFEFEVIVGDDGSTDGTVAVIRKVAARFPNLRVIAHPRNVGVKDNYFSVHDSARGEYVAHLDGDDYWLPGKLQAQVQCLQAHPQCAVAWHPMITFDERGLHYIIGDHGDLLRESLGKDYVELKDAVAAYGITGYHSSLMYRRSARTLFEYSARFLIDYRLSLSLLESGAGYHMKRPLGCYRAFHDHSATRGGTDVVGPGLLLTLSDYAASHPHLKPQIVAHCLSVFLRRNRFQAHLVGLLLTRLAQMGKHLTPLSSGRPANDEASAVSANRIFHDNISLKRRLVGQYHFFANSTRLLAFGLRQKTVPSIPDAVRAVRVGSYLSRHIAPKAGFFEKKYGEPRRKAPP